MANELLLLGMLLILAGFALVFFSASGGSSNAGGVVFIGPIPIAFGSFNNPETVKILWIIGIALFVLLLLFGSGFLK